MWESHPYLSNPKAFDIFSVVKLSLLAAMVSFLGAWKRNAKKSKQVLGWHLGTWLLKQFLSDKVCFTHLGHWTSAFRLWVCNFSSCCWQRMPWSVFNKLSWSQSQMGFPNRNRAHAMMYCIAGRRSLSADPSQGAGENTGSLYMNVSKLPDVSFPLADPTVYPRVPLILSPERTSSDFPNKWVILGLPTQSPETKADKTHKEQNKKQQQSISEENGQKRAKWSLTSLDCLETWSATLGFCMIFSQMSGSFSSLSFHPMVLPGVKRQQFQSKGIVSYSLITTSFPWLLLCHSATHLSGLSVQYTHTPLHPSLEWELRVYIMCYLVSLLCVSHI